MRKILDLFLVFCLTLGLTSASVRADDAEVKAALPAQVKSHRTRTWSMAFSAGGKDSKIIAVTASAMDENRQALMEIGADDFISKPFREADLFQKIHAHASHRRQQSEA